MNFIKILIKQISTIDIIIYLTLFFFPLIWKYFVKEEKITMKYFLDLLSTTLGIFLINIVIDFFYK